MRGNPTRESEIISEIRFVEKSLPLLARDAAQGRLYSIDPDDRGGPAQPEEFLDFALRCAKWVEERQAELAEVRAAKRQAGAA